MRVKKELTIEDTNGTRVLSTSMQTTYPGTDADIFFRGSIYYVRFNRKGEIKFDASLSKFEKATKTRYTGIPFINGAWVEKDHEKRLWEVNTGRYERKTPPNGSAIPPQTNITSYKKELSDRLIKQYQINIEHDLITEVFSPLEEQIKEFMDYPAEYQQA